MPGVLGRVAIPLTVALFIDGLQFLVTISFFGVGTALQASTPVGGGVAGAVAGCVTNASVWYDIFGCAKGAAAGGLLGAGISAIGLPLGIAMGIVINFCISLSFGAALIMLLGFQGMFYPSLVFTILFGEIAPFFGNFPFWTLLVILCGMKKAGEKVPRLAWVAAATTPSTGALRAVRSVRTDGIARRS